MEKMEKFRVMMTRCRSILNRGYTSTRNSGIAWLNSFCAEFLEFTSSLHKYIAKEMSTVDGNETVETIFLCLSQIVVCIKHMERTIKAEEASGVAISSSRQHFLDRIHWCLERLRVSLRSLAKQSTVKPLNNELNFIELMDLALDQLAPYSSYKERNVSNIAEENAEAMFTSKQLRSTVDLILSHTLAFANVALQEDKKALSALCQKVLRECIAFQDECSLNEQKSNFNDCNRKLKAMSVENALYQLEDFMNEALLRLVYHTFLDHSKLSIEKLRNAMRSFGHDDPALDELIADFDVNVDRTTQIGVFAIAFAPSVKIRTTVRSCLASLESLDACIIPALQTETAHDMHAEILEQHYNEEVAKFKCVIQEIIDSYAFTSAFYEILSKYLNAVEKSFDKVRLQELVQMAEFLFEHFQLPVNAKELKQLDGGFERLQLYEKFVLMLRECQAILSCADQVEPQRILKRFKILRSVVRKFLDSLSDASTQARNKEKEEVVFIMSEDLSDSQRMFESIGIAPSIPSILYQNDSPMRRRRAASDSLKANYSRLPLTSPLRVSNLSHAMPHRMNLNVSPLIRSKRSRMQAEAQAQAKQETRGSVRRKESLRTAMFKHRKSVESKNAYESYKNNSASLQISEILDQLTNLSTNFTNASKTNGDGDSVSSIKN